ncbi:hypothetical protein BDR03DRAFT_948986, partial [Suillus americanus]
MILLECVRKEKTKQLEIVSQIAIRTVMATMTDATSLLASTSTRSLRLPFVDYQYPVALGWMLCTSFSQTKDLPG